MAQVHHKAVFLAFLAIRAWEYVANGADLTDHLRHSRHTKNTAYYSAPLITSSLYKTASLKFLNFLHIPFCSMLTRKPFP